MLTVVHKAIFFTIVQKMEEQAEYKQKGGRPKKEEKRTLSVGVRLSEQERLRILGKAEQAGLRLSDYIRDMALKGKPRRTITEEERKLYRQLTGLANNLNQLTKEAHRQEMPSIMGSLIKTLNETNKILSLLNDYKNEHR